MDPISSSNPQPLPTADAEADATSSPTSRSAASVQDALEAYRSTGQAPTCTATDDPFYRPASEDGKLLEALQAHARGEVELCKRIADLPGARQLHLEHHWLRTAHKEAGMGAQGGGVPGHHLDLPYVTQVTINDHRGEGAKAEATCTEVPNADAQCVDRLLQNGRQLGRWTPTNQCQTFAAEVLASCTPKAKKE